MKNIYLATDGDDTDDGLTPETAKATIAEASVLADPGDIVLVGPGVYTEPWIDLAGGSSRQSHVVYQSADADQPALIRPLSGTRPLFIVQQHITIMNVVFDAQHMDLDACKITHGGGSHAFDIALVNCTVRNAFGNGILTSGKSSGVGQIVIDGCDIFNNGRAGNRFRHGIYNTVDDVRITGCHLKGNAGWGIHCYSEEHKPSRVFIDGNHVHDNGWADTRYAAGIGVYHGEEIELGGTNNVHDNPRQIVFNTGFGS